MKYIRYVSCLSMLILGLILPACWPGSKSKEAGQRGKLAVVNVLGPKEYNDAHIKGSINVPFSELNEAAQKWSKDTKVVVYCANYMCTSSSEAAKMLTAAGFNDVRAYEGGVAEWKQKGFPVEGPAQAEYLANVGQKPSGTEGVKTVTAEELKEEIDKASKAGELVEK